MSKTEYRYSIKLVARRTGLSAHAIRVWEKRYNAVLPARTETNRRLYSDADMERLLLLHKATLDGHAIGQIAKLPTEQLRQLFHTAEATPSVKSVQTNKTVPTSSAAILENCLQFVKQLDPERLQRALEDAEVALSRPRFIEQLIAPLLQKIGELWRDGTLRVIHEHMATAVTRSFLGNVRSAYDVPETAPGVITTTPVGQLHELGALMASATASAEGWRVTYLGPNLPAEEIAAAARQNQARAVALSIVYPTDDPRLEPELQKLRRLLPGDVALLIGGRAAVNYRTTLEMLGVQLIKDMASFSAILEALRVPAVPS